MRRYLALPLAICLALLITAGAALASDDWKAAEAAYKRGDYATSARIIRKLALQGLAKAQAQLGYMYVRGLGVPRSYAEAVKWYRQAAEQGVAKAQYNLGVCYDTGQGVPRSYAQAVKWWRRAAAQGHAKAQFNLGVCYLKGEGVPRDYVRAYKWILLAAGQGHPKAIRVGPILARRMTPAQIAEAKRLAAKFRPKKAR
ncbi:MAG: sel1 repeat family protein [Proteobacteria bacterium]|nr:sel1 repeat family protein [Pseudomonadota bacterium]